MVRPHATLLLAALALAAAAPAAADVPDLTGSMELLCNPNKSRWASTSANDARSRAMTSIVPHRGRLYVSGGCWDPNTGYAPIFSVDPQTGAFVREYQAGSERFDYFREASTGHLYAPVTDQHEDGPNWGALFRRDPDGTWRCFRDIIPRGDFPAGTFGNIDNQGFAIHTWDLCCWKGSVFTAGYGIAYGPEGSDGTMANATPGLGIAYRQFKASDSSYTSYYRRFYAFLPFEDDLFCTTLNYSPASAPEINAFEEWRFDAAAGVFRCEERPWSEFAPGVTAQDRAAVSGTYVAPANTTPFKGRVLYLLGPSSVDSPRPWCLFTAENVDHHVKAAKVDLGGATPFCIHRHAMGRGGEVVDVLAAEFDASDRTVVNSVWESFDGVSFEKLFTFRTAQQASALARVGDDFYVGLGWRFATTWNLACRDGASGNDGDDASGDLYRVSFRPDYPKPSLGAATATVAKDRLYADLSVEVLSAGKGGLSLSLSLDGDVVKTWTGIVAPGVFEWTVATDPGSSHSFAFSAVDAAGSEDSADGVFSASTLDGWFDVRFSDPGYVAGTNWWRDLSRVSAPGGSWTAADAASALVGVAGSAPRHVELNATAGIEYAANAPSRDGADATVRGRVRLAAECAPPDAPAADELGGLAFVGGEGGAIVPWGFVAGGGGWFAFDAPAAPLEDGAWHDWAVDLDLSSAAAPAARFRLDGVALLRAGAEWQPLPAGTAHARGAAFRGAGAIGDFRCVYPGGGVVGEPVVPAFGGGSPLAFGTDPGTGGPTFSMTVVNAVEGCYYTVFAASALDDDFVAEKDGEPAPADGTLVLTAPAGAPARFFRIVVSTFPVEAGTLFSSLPLSP